MNLSNLIKKYLEENSLMDLNNTMSRINKQLETIILNQSKLIDRLLVENKTLKLVVDTHTGSLSRLELTLNKLSSQNHIFTPIVQPTPKQQPSMSYARAISSNTESHQDTPRPQKRQNSCDTQGRKKKHQKIQFTPNDNTNPKNNDEDNNNAKHPNPQKSLKTFDSFNPEDPPRELTSDKDEGFKIVGPKKKSKSKKLKSNSSEFYLCNSGKGQNIGFESCERKYEVYLGRVDSNVDNKKVEEYVAKVVNIHKFEQLSLQHKKFKSFKFEISIFDKDKISDKTLSPRGTIINRYRRPYVKKSVDKDIIEM
ncbi:unnamed protein product [Brachionus calyciflorus]|uniref:Uncharacterized protein n=1 Tax=Brachionus calyciflorus TaxID=104777 RepID=A0A814IZ35_9BILA|nr:unnamed protein product [Brachionus calyciflorus]